MVAVSNENHIPALRDSLQVKEDCIAGIQTSTHNKGGYQSYSSVMRERCSLQKESQQRDLRYSLQVKGDCIVGLQGSTQQKSSRRDSGLTAVSEENLGLWALRCTQLEEYCFAG